MSKDKLLKFQTPDGLIFKNLVGVLAPALVDANLIFDEKGLHIEGLTTHPDSPTTVRLNYAADKGRVAYINQISPTTVGLDLKSLRAHLADVKAGTTVSLEMTEAEYNASSPTIRLSHWTPDDTYTATLKLLELPEIKLNLDPKEEYHTALTMSSAHLDRIFKRYTGSFVNITVAHNHHINIAGVKKQQSSTAGIQRYNGKDLSRVQQPPNNSAIHLAGAYNIKELKSIFKAAALAPNVSVFVPAKTAVARFVFDIKGVGELEFRLRPVPEDKMEESKTPKRAPPDAAPKPRPKRRKKEVPPAPEFDSIRCKACKDWILPDHATDEDTGEYHEHCWGEEEDDRDSQRCATCRCFLSREPLVHEDAGGFYCDACFDSGYVPSEEEEEEEEEKKGQREESDEEEEDDLKCKDCDEPLSQCTCDEAPCGECGEIPILCLCFTAMTPEEENPTISICQRCKLDINECLCLDDEPEDEEDNGFDNDDHSYSPKGDCRGCMLSITCCQCPMEDEEEEEEEKEPKTKVS